MSMWHFCDVLDSTESQCLGLLLIEHVWDVLIIECVFYTVSHFVPCHAMPCTSSAHTMHYLLHSHASVHAHTCTVTYFHASCLCLHVLAVIAWCFEFAMLCFKLFYFCFGTNLNLIKFCVLFCVCAPISFPCIYVFMCRCLHLKAQLWKKAATKGKNRWLMFMTRHLGQKGLALQRECITLTCSNPILRFRHIISTFKRLHCWLKEPLTSHLSLTPIFPYGLPPRIGTFFSQTLRMRMRTWWKSFMLMPLLKERRSSAGLEERGSQLHLSTWWKSYTSTSQYYLYHRYMMNWIQMRRFFGKL